MSPVMWSRWEVAVFILEESSETGFAGPVKTVGAFPKLQMALQNQHVNGKSRGEEVGDLGSTEPYLPRPLSTELELVSEALCRALWGCSFSAADLVLSSLLRAWSYSEPSHGQRWAKHHITCFMM